MRAPHVRVEVRWQARLGLLLLAVAAYGPCIEQKGKGRKYGKLETDVTDAASLQVDHAHDFHKVAQRIEVGDALCPFRHAADGGKQSAHQDENQHAESHDEHGLLHGGRVIGNDQPQSRHDQCENQGGQVNGQHVSCRS